MIGHAIGPYHVLASLGEGGMGEVYRARDAKLGRDVAIKVLPPDFAGDTERIARFEREARSLAALNHPHIAQVYGFEDFGAGRALVMELVPGESLAARVARGPAPLREALDLARQVADGLGAAHEKGIVHRDLKPANVQVTPDGVAKVLDFGLAKPGSPTDASDEHAATITSPATLTRRGIVLGTAAYMSPEQARGLPVDARTDIWAFGCVLYELLSGTRPFPGPSITDTLAQVLERDPDWTTLPATTPAAIRALVRRCLQKSPKQRLHDIADARFAIEDALAALTSSSAGVAVDADDVGRTVPRQPPRAVWRHPLPISLALMSMTLGSVLTWSLLRRPAEPAREPQFLSFSLPPGQDMTPSFDVSDDGRHVVYSATADEGPPGPEGDVTRIYHRRMDGPGATALAGTEGAELMAISPDGAWVAFRSVRDNTFRKVAVAGGGPVLLAQDRERLPGSWKGHWTDDGRLLVPGSPFRRDPIQAIPVAGGPLEEVVPTKAIDGVGELYTPRALPNNRGTLFGTFLGGRSGISAWVAGERRELIGDGFQPTLVSAGRILIFWRRAGPDQVDLCAVRFDLPTVKVVGEPVVVLSAKARGGWSYSVVPSGRTLMYRPDWAFRPAAVRWLQRGERPLPALPAPSLGAVGRFGMRVSPDGQQVLFTTSFIDRPWETSLFTLATGTTRTVATAIQPPIWSHDGRHIIYFLAPLRAGAAPGESGLMWKPLDGSGAPERLTTSQAQQVPQSVTHDGRHLVFVQRTESNWDVWLLPLSPRGEPRPLLNSTANESQADVSPDGRWMAYVSDESGRDEIWVRKFPEGAAGIQVSRDGGIEPLWSRDGRTLYYRDATGQRLSSVAVGPGEPPDFGAATVTVGRWRRDRGVQSRGYDIAPDGSLIIAPQITFEPPGIVLNFDVLVQRKLAEAPTGGAAEVRQSP